MANITYTVNQDTPQSIPNIEVFSQEDTTLVNNFQINQLFDSNKHSVELHIYNLAGELIESDYNYINYKELGNAASAGKEGASILTVDPVADVELYGYGNGDVKLLYNFVDDLYAENRSTVEFFIDSISPDRTELKLKTFNLTPEEVSLFTSTVKTRLEIQSYFNEFRINLLDNNLFIGVNIDTLQEVDDTSVVVKLYEPLPEDIPAKSTVSVVELVSDSVVYEVTSILETEEVPALGLRSPNFNLDLIDESVIPTGYYDYDTLLSLPISNTTNELYSLVNSKGVQLSIDHNDYSNFVHFSSAQERLLNFKYKFDLIQSYNAQIASFQTVTTPSLGTTGSLAYYESLVKGIVNNFDHYERFLYYESGSNSWPKTNSTKPYINDTTSIGDAWFNSKQTVAATYDVTNTNILINSIPSYLRDDSANASYITFIHMIGQHFDNMWIYAKGVSDKYNADNRLDFGVSRDLVAEVLKNFGVKLYTSNKSVEDLFSSFIGQPYQSGSEVINTYVTGSVTGSNTPIQPSSFDNYQREVYKRMYHNLPLLLKSKGTERGLRALINCLGIPSDILDIKIYGGRNRNERPFYGDYRYYTSSLDKIRLDNTGSIISGSTLSQYTSTLKKDDKYTDDLHPIEIGFSPTDNIDNYIISKSLSTASLASFNIDDYIGDPRNLYLDNYFTFTPAGSITGSLDDLTTSIMSGSSAYDVQDFVRLIKFFDNTIFKMVKDFVPARSTVNTGIIIKPHVLGRSKAKSVIATGSKPDYSGSIDTAFISGRNTTTFKIGESEYSTAYDDYNQTPTGIELGTSHLQNEARYNGEISGSTLSVSNVNLNNANIYKDLAYSATSYQVNFISSSNEVCLLGTAPTPFYITSSTGTWNANQFFTFTNPNFVYSASNSVTSPVWTPITFPRSFPLVQPVPSTPGYFQDFLIKATNRDVTVPSPGSCTTDIQVRFATCSLFLSPTGVQTTNVIGIATGGPITDLTTWITNPNNQLLQYTASYSTSSVVDPIPSPSTYQFNQRTGTIVTITVRDANIGDVCSITKSVTVGTCTLGLKAKTTAELVKGFQFQFSKYQYGTWAETDPVLNEGGTATPVGSGYTRLNSTLPGAVTGTGISQYRGIQSFFTLSGNLGTSLTQNPSIRYNIYRLINTTELTDSNREDKYRLITVAEGINPSQPPSTWIPGVDPFATDTTFKNTFNISDPGLYGSDNNFYAIVLNIEDSNSIIQYVENTGNTTQDVPVNQLTRAYVIEAYNAAQESCIQQTVVYGPREVLKTAEGSYPTGEPQFIVKDILVDWDYVNQGTPTATYPNPVVINGVLRPWKRIKIRKYGTPAIGTPP